MWFYSGIAAKERVSSYQLVSTSQRLVLNKIPFFSSHLLFCNSVSS